MPGRPLLTLRIFLSEKIFKICKVSVPIPILLPTETPVGILVTYISVDAAPEEVICVVSPIFPIDDTFTLNRSFNLERIEVLNPDIVI